MQQSGSFSEQEKTPYPFSVKLEMVFIVSIFKGSANISNRRVQIR